MWMCCEMPANFVWNTHEKSRISVRNIIIAFGHCSNIVRLMYEMYVNFVQSCCEISANFVWNTCEKSMIAVGNVVIAFGHCCIIVQLIY